MRLDTPICQLLGVEHPLGNAGMAGMARHRLAAAVAEAGGIGTIALGGSSVDEVRSELAACCRRSDTSGSRLDRVGNRLDSAGSIA